MRAHDLPPDRRPNLDFPAEDGEYAFVAQLWQWNARRPDTWTFVTVPEDTCAAIEEAADRRGPRAGFGSVKVQVRVGETTWQTSLFPDAASRRFVLPIKRQVREANSLAEGDAVVVRLRIA